MGLRCAVLGHRYGDRERVEERSRDGSEVIVTLREQKTCERCGESLVVSESKEVTTAHGASPREQPQPEPEPDEPEPDFDGPTEVRDPAPDPDPETEDAEIIEDDPGDRDPGQWPSDPAEAKAPESLGLEDSDSQETSDKADQAWPETEADDEGFDATIEGDEAQTDDVIEAVTMQEPAEDAEETEAGFFRASPIESPSDPDKGSVHTEFYCPRCDWSAPSLTTSVRRGDICPSCRTGYVAEQDPS